MSSSEVVRGDEIGAVAGAEGRRAAVAGGFSRSVAQLRHGRMPPGCGPGAVAPQLGAANGNCSKAQAQLEKRRQARISRNVNRRA